MYMRTNDIRYGYFDTGDKIHMIDPSTPDKVLVGDRWIISTYTQKFTMMPPAHIWSENSSSIKTINDPKLYREYLQQHYNQVSTHHCQLMTQTIEYKLAKILRKISKYHQFNNYMVTNCKIQEHVGVVVITENKITMIDFEDVRESRVMYLSATEVESLRNWIHNGYIFDIQIKNYRSFADPDYNTRIYKIESLNAPTGCLDGRSSVYNIDVYNAIYLYFKDLYTQLG